MFALFAVNMLVVMLTVAIHYEFLYWMTRLLPKLNIVHRARIVFGVAGGLLEIGRGMGVWCCLLRED